MKIKEEAETSEESQKRQEKEDRGNLTKIKFFELTKLYSSGHYFSIGMKKTFLLKK